MIETHGHASQHINVLQFTFHLSRFTSFYIFAHQKYTHFKVTKRKLIRFAENATFKHLFQPSKEDLVKGFVHRGKWRAEYFMNNHPIVLELGCGKGEYTVGLAQKFPQQNFIGIDIKGARLWRGCKTVEEEGMPNAAFIRSRIEFIDFIFNQNEVDEIWLTFPDPHPKKVRQDKRLSSQRFIDRYSKILKPAGIIHLKTDNLHLFEYSLEVIHEHKHELLYSTPDLYSSDYEGAANEFQTFYESKFRQENIPIKYLEFRIGARE